MPLSLQTKMLRFLQERVIERIGGRKEINIDIRVICATHRDIQSMVKDETFRGDLFYRVGEIVIDIPPLRNRENDVLLFAKIFLKQYAADYGSKIKGFSQSAIKAMVAYQWPGNIRELQNKLKSAVILAEGNVIHANDLSLMHCDEKSKPVLNLRKVREESESRAIRQAYIQAEKNMSKTAELLGVTRPTLYALLDKYHLEVLKTTE